jgi:biotin carboxylase
MQERIQNKKILILGAGTWQVPYLKKAKELGLQVFATDWSENAEGKNYADVFEPIDLKNKEATLAFAQKYHVDAIFTSADIGVQNAAFVAKQLNLPYQSEEIALISTNKYAMRDHAAKIGLGIPKYKVVADVQEALLTSKEIGFPLVIKPVDNFSSRGVCVIYNEEELEGFFPKSMAASFSKKVLLEEFMIGTEGSVEALVQDGEVFIMGICSKEKSPLPYRYDLKLTYPGLFTESQFLKINEFILDLAKGYGIRNGVLHVEIMVNENRVRLIEFAIRGCGSKVVTHLMPAMLDYDVVKHLISNAFGIKQKIQFAEGKQGILEFIMLPKGKIKNLEGIEEVRKIPGVLDFDIERKPGDEIDVIEDGRSRPGYLLAFSNSKDGLNQLLEKAHQTYKVSFY